MKLGIILGNFLSKVFWSWEIVGKDEDGFYSNNCNLWKYRTTTWYFLLFAISIERKVN